MVKPETTYGRHLCCQRNSEKKMLRVNNQVARISLKYSVRFDFTFVQSFFRFFKIFFSFFLHSTEMYVFRNIIICYRINNITMTSNVECCDLHLQITPHHTVTYFIASIVCAHNTYMQICNKCRERGLEVLLSITVVGQHANRLRMSTYCLISHLYPISEFRIKIAYSTFHICGRKHFNY